MNSNYIISVFICVLILSCQNDSRELKEDIFACSFNKLKSSTKLEESEKSNTIKIDARIQANLKKLTSIGGELSISDSIVLNRIKEKSINTAIYSSEFLEKHNGIVEVLCSIEREMKDTTLSMENRNRLREDLWEKRTMYFNLLIGSNSGNTIRDEKRNNREQNQVRERAESMKEISLYIDADLFDVSSFKVDGKPVSLLPESTNTNIRFMVKADRKEVTLELSIIDGESCKKQFFIGEQRKKYVFHFSAC